jgi:serine acetyltransferase/glycosyltransferase involved in cell wall biosynthesis
MPDDAPPRLSVVIATYDRRALVTRLVRQLDDQTLDPGEYEIIVVDDGSPEPVRPALEALSTRRRLRVETQRNAGPAAARHRAVLAASGELVVVLDDDMQVGREFLAEHLQAHPPGSRRLVLGAIRAPPDAATMPLHERWHQRLLDRFAAEVASGRSGVRGCNVYTGNVSFRRDDYLAVGGFDPTLGRSEDAELGLRLEKSGVELALSQAAYSINGSDHTRLSSWRRRGELYGVYEYRIARKHPDLRDASPWRYWSELNALSRPLLLGSAAVPLLSRVLGTLVYAAASGADRLGFDRVATAGTTLTFGLDYYRGVALELGSATALLADLRAYQRAVSSGASEPCRTAALRRFRSDVRADHATMRGYESRYGHHEASSGRVGQDFVQKIGLQIMTAVRGMRLLRDAGGPLGAKVVSRAIRHLYGSEVHWDAELEPGVVLVHGMGLAISHAAHVSTGCILFQNVTLGMGIDPVTRRTGAPWLERDVHVGPGATLLGPITVGEGSKIAAGAVVTRSIPPRSLVIAAAPTVSSRPAEAAPPAVVGEPERAGAGPGT